MAETTPRGWTIPTPGSDRHTWGDITNNAWRQADADVTANEDAIEALEESQKKLMVDILNIQEPVGTVKMYNSAGSIPDAWHECDGSNGTPDLRGRVIVSATGGNLGRTGGSKHWYGTSQTVAITGGNHNHGLSGGTVNQYTANTGNHALTIQQMPAHSHGMNVAYTYLTGRSQGTTFDRNVGGTGQLLYRQSIPRTDNDGGGQPHSHNMNHSHSLSGTTNSSTSHNHNATIPIGAVYGLRMIMKTRLLTVEDLP